MSGRVIWRAVAEEDLTEACLYVGADSPEAAERLLDAVGDEVALLLENPQAGSPREFRSSRAQDVRSWAPRGFPNHLIFYAFARSAVTTSSSSASSTERETYRTSSTGTVEGFGTSSTSTR